MSALIPIDSLKLTPNNPGGKNPRARQDAFFEFVYLYIVFWIDLCMVPKKPQFIPAFVIPNLNWSKNGVSSDCLKHHCPWPLPLPFTPPNPRDFWQSSRKSCKAASWTGITWGATAWWSNGEGRGGFSKGRPERLESGWMLVTTPRILQLGYELNHHQKHYPLWTPWIIFSWNDLT